MHAPVQGRTINYIDGYRVWGRIRSVFAIKLLEAAPIGTPR